MTNLVVIDKGNLEELVRDSLTLNSLENAGVDNWEGYDFAESPNDEEVEMAVKAYLVEEAKNA